jgi:C4-dicarboxylate-specific signal transduction histidine kinase
MKNLLHKWRKARLRKKFAQLFTTAEQDHLLRSLERNIEAHTPDFKTANEAKEFNIAPTEPFASLRTLHQKIYEL